MFTKKLVSFVVSDRLILKGFIRKFNCLDMCYATDCPLRLFLVSTLKQKDVISLSWRLFA